MGEFSVLVPPPFLSPSSVSPPTERGLKGVTYFVLVQRCPYISRDDESILQPLFSVNKKYKQTTFHSRRFSVLAVFQNSLFRGHGKRHVFGLDVEDIFVGIVCVCDGQMPVVLGCDRQQAVPLLTHTLQISFWREREGEARLTVLSRDGVVWGREEAWCCWMEGMKRGMEMSLELGKGRQFCERIGGDDPTVDWRFGPDRNFPFRT